MRYQADFVLRLIEQMGQMLRAAMEKLAFGHSDEAYELAQEAIGRALSFDPDLVERLSPASLVSLMGMDTIDDRVTALVCEALEIEAQALEATGDILEAGLRREQAGALRDLLEPDHAN